MNAQVGAYESTCAALARKIARTGRARRARAEYDDLVQEGRIAVWQALARGITPAAAQIEQRMMDWVRLMGGQIGQWSPQHRKTDDTTLPAQHVNYERLLPLDDLRVRGDD
jgi:hypothetical protein